MIEATFGHVNVIARDWRALAGFYTREAVLAAGGGVVGEIVTTQTKDGRYVTWAYLTDPEGNILELQAWSDTAP